MGFVATNARAQMRAFYPPPYAFAGPTFRRKGLGDVSTGQIESIAATGASTTVGILVALGTLGGPAGAAIAGLIGVGTAIASMFHGCGQTCVIATQDANKSEQLLQQNLSAYQNAPVHYQSIQQAALNNVDTLFAALKQACSDPSLGSAGQRCISERLVPGGTAPWCPKPGHTGCDWYVLYRDPIANDPNVVPDPTPQSAASTIAQDVSAGAQSLVNAVTSGAGITLPTLSTPLLLGGGALLLGLILFGSSR
jgi:hypothetical protein